ncbi:MAG TPA: nucleotide sugar dehydrogenase [Burkholderiales bacterium]|nr:nucleotide sugar dehydrogenase [Burkholderiales bacterium]
MKQALLQKIRDRKAVVAVVGLGYVGLPLALRFSECGFRVIGIDTDAERVAQLAKGATYIARYGSERISAALKRGFTPANSFAEAARADAILICVPTPLTAQREPDLSHVRAAADALAPYLRAGQLVSLESTTYPGTTEEELLPRVARRGLKVGKDIFVCFSPEREDPGNARFPTHAIPKILGGTTPECVEVGTALYGAAIDKVVAVSSTRTAEMVKLLENVHRAVNIGLANEMKIICERMGIDVHEVIRAAATKPFGFVPYWPGPGLGGHCIPIDPFYLTWKARAYGVHTRFIELAGEINAAMPLWVLGKVADALNARGKSVRGSRILVLGVAYKKNVDDLRESPALELMRLLADKGAKLAFSDPHVPALRWAVHDATPRDGVKLTADLLAGQDLVLIATDHDAFDYDLILKNSSLIVDTRGRYLEPAANVVKA